MSYRICFLLWYAIGTKRKGEYLMYSFLALFSGIILAVMIQMNGNLGARFGVYHAALYVHVVGSVFAAGVLAVRKKRFVCKCLPLWMYSGGAIGVVTTVFNNLAFTRISLTSIIALGLFAQLVFSYLIDMFGWFGMERRRQKDISIPGILLSVLGIVLMLEAPMSGGWGYIAISLGAGISVVLSRTVNASLSKHTGALWGSLINHLVGLPFCLILALGVSEVSAPGRFRLWIWGGGILGVITVMICNIIVPKIPAYRVTVFSFVGQLFCGIALDILDGSILNSREFFAGLLVAAGIAVNQILGIRRIKK